MKGYLSVVLDSSSRERLLAYAGADQRQVCHHITLVFGCSDTDFPTGEVVSVRAVSIHADSRGVAARVELPEDLLGIINRAPHVTISLAQGEKPMVSNEIIKGDGVGVELNLSGVIEFTPLG